LVRVVAKAGKGEWSKYAYIEAVKLLQKNEQAESASVGGDF